MFLTMLARLERQNFLKPDSEFRNLALVMTMYIKFANELRNDFSVFQGTADDSEDDDESEDEPKQPSNKMKPDLDLFEAYIFAYAKKYNINLDGPLDVLDLDTEGEVELPKVGADPWDWAASLRNYKKSQGSVPILLGRKTAKIGGDNYDITAMSSAERKKACHRGKDPLSKEEIDAIKMGMILQMG